MQIYKIQGIQVCSCSFSELNQYILEACQEKRKKIILSGNIHSFNLANKIPWLKEYFNKADLVRCDGAGIVLAGKILGYNMKKRITWVDYGWEFSKFCEKKSLTLFFLGDRHGIAELAKRKLAEKYKELKILGCFHGYFNKYGEENHQVVEIINNLSPDVLLVGFGTPIQEKWIKENVHKLNVSVILTCGAAFEFISGAAKRCPKWMGDIGLEWLFRLIQEPKRLWKRYLVGNTVFIWLVLRDVFKKRVFRKDV